MVFEGQPNNAVNTGNVGQYIEADGGGDPGDTTLTLTITALPTHGTLWFNGVAVTVGQTFDYADRNLLTYANDGSETVAPTALAYASPTGRRHRRAGQHRRHHYPDRAPGG